MAGRAVREYSVRYDDEGRRMKGLEFEMRGTTLCITLPSGRMICYPEAAITTNRFGSESIKYRGIDQATNKWVWLETYGGKLTENITQAVARDCLAEVLRRLDDKGLPVVFHVHDEVIVEARSGNVLKDVEREFDTPVDWAPGLPLKGAGYYTWYYKKD